ncbi:hypothetical protein EWM64_g9717, partial [Hericium alpestre]
MPTFGPSFPRASECQQNTIISLLSSTAEDKLPSDRALFLHTGLVLTLRVIMQHPYVENSIYNASHVSVSQYPVQSRTMEGTAVVTRRKTTPSPRPSKTEMKLPTTEKQVAIASGLSTRHFVKQDNLITLILAGHMGDAQQPMYTSGSIVSGLVTLSKVTGISAIEVKMEGGIKVKETAGGGSGSSQLISDTLYVWDQQLHQGPPPSEFTFRGRIPAHHNDTSREPQVLPASFDSRLTAVPGFRVRVQYEFVVSVTRVWMVPVPWKRQIRLRVQFVYKPLTRPAHSGPFPLISNTSSKRPHTAFVDMIRPRKPGCPPIETQIYLPGSQITPITERISFRVTFTGPDAYLLPFFESTPSLPSFHPMPFAQSATSLTSSLPNSMRQPLLGRGSRPTPTGPLRMSIVRQIGADARATGVVVLTPFRGRSAIAASATLAEGCVFQAEKGSGWIRWWGEISVPPDVQCCGFTTDKLTVKDVLVLDVNLPGFDTHVLPFKQS